MLRLPALRVGAIASLAAALLLTASQLSAPVAHAEDVLPPAPVASTSTDSGASSDVAAIAAAASNYTGSAMSAVDLADAASAVDSVALKMHGEKLIAVGVNGAEVAVAAEGGVTLSAPGTPSIGIRAAGDADSTKTVGGAVFQAGVAAGTDVVTRATRDGVQLVAILADQDARNTIDFDLELPKGATLVQQADGSVGVMAPVKVEMPKPGEIARVMAAAEAVLGAEYDGRAPLSKEQRAALSRIRPVVTQRKVVVQEVASIAKPWAVDAVGNSVDTRYVIEGDTLRQVVTTNEATAYPVVVDPKTTKTWYGWAVWFSNKETNKIVKLLGGIAGALTLLAALQAAGVITIGGAGATAIAAGLFALGAGGVAMCNWNDKGISVKIWSGGAAACWPR